MLYVTKFCVASVVLLVFHSGICCCFSVLQPQIVTSKFRVGDFPLSFVRTDLFVITPFWDRNQMAAEK